MFQIIFTLIFQSFLSIKHYWIQLPNLKISFILIIVLITPSVAFGISINDIIPRVRTVSIPNTAMKIGDTITATITITSNIFINRTDLSSLITGSIGGFTLVNVSKTNNTTYTATFTIANGGTDIANSDDIPVNLELADNLGNQITIFNTAISQTADAIDATTFNDNAGNTFTGLNDTSSWNFTTVSNSAPTITLPTATMVSENTRNIAIADDIAIADADSDNQSVTLTLTGGTASIITTGLSFTTGDGTDDSSMVFSGTLTAVNAALDSLTFSPTANISGSNAGAIQIQTDDGNNGTDDNTLTFIINDIDPVINDATVSLAENSANNTAVTTVTSSGDSNGLTYSITAGNTNNAFTIDASTGVITVNDSNELNFETATHYSLTVSVDDEDTDSNSDDTATITVNITDVDL